MGWPVAAPVLTRWGGAFAVPPPSPGLLLVFLRGGYDCANAIIPYSSDFYYEARPSIAIARPTAGDAAGALRLDGDWALAPALRATIGARFEKREVAFVPFAGPDDLSRSHFETQDYIERGQPASSAQDFRSGFLARLAGVLTGASPIAFTDALPRCFQGANVPNVSLRGVGKPAFDERQSSILAGMYKGNRPRGSGRRGAGGAPDRRARAGPGAPRGQPRLNQPEGVRARSSPHRAPHARPVSTRLRGRRRMGHPRRRGRRAGRTGEQPRQPGPRTGCAGRGARARAGSDTVVVVISEFGRTFRENGNKGTDHGHGSTYWILGGGIRGGAVVGPQVKVERATLLQDRDYPVLTDVRSLLGGLFSRMFGLSTSDLDRVFPGAVPADLGLV